MVKFTEISPQNLMRLIGLPDAPHILDVCIDADFADDPYLVPGSIRVSAKDVMQTPQNWADRPIVVICQKGKKLSHGTAAFLRATGLQAEVLTGGMYGWKDAQLPRIPASQIPKPTTGPSLWVTRHRPKIDRIACPWLIRRFIDPQATFLFVPPADVIDVADKFDATPFDVNDVQFTHRDNQCSFDTMIADFELSHPALDALATIVRAADLGQLDQSDHAAGLLAISVGLSRQYSNDAAQLEASIPIYDALYRWARDGQDESHSSTLTSGA